MLQPPLHAIVALSFSGASIFLSNPGDDVVTEGDVFMVCANFQSLPLQRNMSVGLSIPVDSQGTYLYVSEKQTNKQKRS